MSDEDRPMPVGGAAHTPETEAMTDAERAAPDVDALVERLEFFFAEDRGNYPIGGDQVRQAVEVLALTTVCARVIAANVVNIDAAAFGCALFAEKLQREMYRECVARGLKRRAQ